MRFLISLFLLIHFGSYGQIRNVLVNSKTNKAIPYASIYIKNTDRGTSSNLDGSFTLKLNESDTLIISSIGYKELKVPYNSIRDTLFLDSDIKQMNEVTITSESSFKLFPTRLVIGEVKSSFFTDNYWLGAGGRPYKIARFFKFEDTFEETRFLESITLETLSYKKGSMFSINFFTKGSDGMPEEPLLKNYLICKTGKKRNKVKISLLEHNIFFHREGIFLVIQFLNIDQNRSVRNVPIVYAGTKYKYKYDPSISLTEKESPGLYTFNNKAQRWVLSRDALREIEAELVLTE